MAPLTGFNFGGGRERELTRLMLAHSYPPGVALFEQGTPASDVYYVESGLVKLFHSHANGAESIVGLRFPGWFLGASALIVGCSNTSTATTLARSSIRHIRGVEFLRLLEVDTQVSWQIQQQQALEVLDYARHIAQLGSLSSRIRLEHLLRELILALQVDPPTGEVILPVPLKHWELAGLIGVSPEHLSRLLHQMQTNGLIRKDRGRIVVIEFERLARADEG
jgi:CRP-like cAMP-binding protein